MCKVVQFTDLINWNIFIWKYVKIKWKISISWKFKIWDYSYIAWNCLILWSYNYWLEIWKFCSIASWVSFLIYNDHNQKKLTTYPPYTGAVILAKNKEIWKSITIWNDVRIWMNAIILKWVTIWTWAIIWAWTIITKDIPPYAVVVWNPGKIIKYRFDDVTIKKLLKSERWNRDIEKIRKNYNLEFIENNEN